MCGIAGLVDLIGSFSEDELRRHISEMTDSLQHRGPDAGNIWLDSNVAIALGQRRLSIFDLSETGAQPMVSANGRYIIVYNGEAYNFRELRHELERKGTHFRGSSDTEVVLEACSTWGVHKTVPQLNGMFAFALWDREDRRLTLALDRFGIKPLYWHYTNNSFLFGSELKALRTHPSFSMNVNRGVLASYLQLGYVAGPDSIYQSVQKLMPGTILNWSPGTEPVIHQYWDIHAVARSGLEAPLICSEKEVVDQLETLLCSAVKCRMESDVPLGAFLSGGVDSSMIVALMQSQSTRPVKTFTIGFNNTGYDEAAYAASVARHLGTDHTELYVSETDALDLVPKLPFLYDEPFADSSQIPTHLVSCLAREHVTVSLSGDGGDELFGGYNRHVFSERLNRVSQHIPAPLRKMIAYIPDFTWGALAACINFATPSNKAYPQLREKLCKVASALSAQNADEMYQQFISVWPDAASLVREAPVVTHEHRLPYSTSMNLTQQMMLADMSGYLPGDILTKVDRASMGVGLECRVPFLDYRVVEFAWRIPVQMNVHKGKGKRLLREALYRHVPRSLIERPKAGFAVPIGAWLRGPLKDWAESLLDERLLIEQGFIDPRPVRSVWHAHLSGSQNHTRELWTVLMFQAWLTHSSPSLH